MVVKSIDIPHMDWWDPCMWSDGLNANGYRNFNTPINRNLPLEAAISQRLTQLSGPPVAPQKENPICRYLGHSAVDAGNRRWKLFMEYCPYGTLGQLRRDIANSTQANPPPPEPFVRYRKLKSIWMLVSQAMPYLSPLQTRSTSLTFNLSLLRYGMLRSSCFLPPRSCCKATLPMESLTGDLW